MSKYSEEEKAAARLLTEDISTHPGDIEILRDYRKFMLYKSNTPDGHPAIDCSYENMQAAYGSWSLEGMAKATRLLIDRAGEENFLSQVYSPEEMEQDPEKEDVNIFWFPAKARKKADQPFILAISGGAYTSLCNLSEAFPAAASMNDLGYDVFALDYRVSPDVPEQITESLMPKPLEDTAAALRYIFAHMETYGLSSREYIVCGFSAGASLTVQWGVQSHGYAHYGLPKPKALFPIYPVVDNDLGMPGTHEWFNRIMFGPHCTKEVLDEYAVEKVMTEEYPPCYIVHSENDNIASVKNSYVLNERLEELGIPHAMENPKTAGHGFGDGSGSDAEGWPERALAFIEKM